MGRRLVQVKQCRSNPAIGDCIVRCLAKSMARSVTCRGVSRRSSGYVRPWRAGTTDPRAGYVGCMSLAGRSSILACRGSADAIAGPMKLVRRNCRFGMAGALRDRLHGLPLVDRATTNNGLRRSFTR
jgi:hypothetical protein